MTAMTRRPMRRAVNNVSVAESAVKDWRTNAECRKHDPELFFPMGVGGVPAVAQTKRAKAVCGACPVQAVCLEWALDTGQDSGVWGGLSEKERWQLKADREPRRPAAMPRQSPALNRCLSNQALIEERLADQVSQRKIAKELGVGLESVRRAIVVFATERAALDAASARVGVAG